MSVVYLDHSGAAAEPAAAAPGPSAAGARAAPARGAPPRLAPTARAPLAPPRPLCCHLGDNNYIHLYVNLLLPQGHTYVVIGSGVFKVPGIQ